MLQLKSYMVVGFQVINSIFTWKVDCSHYSFSCPLHVLPSASYSFVRIFPTRGLPNIHKWLSEATANIESELQNRRKRLIHGHWGNWVTKRNLSWLKVNPDQSTMNSVTVTKDLTALLRCDRSAQPWILHVSLCPLAHRARIFSSGRASARSLVCPRNWPERWSLQDQGRACLHVSGSTMTPRLCLGSSFYF